MKALTATLLATAISASFSVYAADAPVDQASYKNMTQKAAADYKAASANCTGMSGAARQVCVEEAKVARARAEVDAVTQYKNTQQERSKARKALAEADYSLAKAKCATVTGAAKESCVKTAHTVHTAALSDAMSDRNMAVASTNPGSPVTSTQTRDPAKAAAVDKCAQIAGQPTTGCLITKEGKTLADRTERAADRAENATERAVARADNATDRAAARMDNATDRAAVRADNATDRAAVAAGTVAQRTENAAERAVVKTDNALERAGEKTERMAETAAAKTERMAETAAAKTERMAENAAVKTERMAETAAVKTERAAETLVDKTKNVAAATAENVGDAWITTKIKADMFSEPELKAMAIDVDTENGVVNLSGFVSSNAEAEKAVRMAQSIKGVTKVTNSLKVAK